MASLSSAGMSGGDRDVPLHERVQLSTIKENQLGERAEQRRAEEERILHVVLCPFMSCMHHPLTHSPLALRCAALLVGAGEKPDYVTFKGVITHIFREREPWYTACPTKDCNKKV